MKLNEVKNNLSMYAYHEANKYTVTVIFTI